MMYRYHYSLTELENMMPYDREIYVTMLIKEIQEEQKRRAGQ
jgi:hypothetical protein